MFKLLGLEKIDNMLRKDYRLYSVEELFAKKIKYIISIGKRQPMHIGHKNSLSRILAVKQCKLIYIIGSSNIKGDPLFDPITNPLDVDQQIKQFKLVFPDVKPIFLAINDIADMSLWGEIIIADLKKLNIKPEECAIHFIGKEEDKLKEEVRFILKLGEEAVLKPGEWLIEALKYWGFYFWFDNFKDTDLSISARNLRKLDLQNLSEEDRKLFAAPDYIIEIAQAAREANPKKEELKNTPITMYDLTLQRLKGF